MSAPSKFALAGRNARLVILLGIAAVVAIAVAMVVVFSNVGGSASSSARPGVAKVINPGPLANTATPVGNSVATPTVGGTVFVGPTPGYLEIAPNGAYGYIANRAAGVLTVFDAVRNTVTGTIPVRDGGPQFVAFSPDGNRAYVSIFNNERTVNEVGVLDTDTGAFIARIPVGVRPFALVVSPDGRRLYVPNHDSGGITVIDTASNNVLATVPVGKSPHSIVAHPSKPLVFVVNYDSSSVSVIDTTSNAVVATVPTGSHPQDVSLAADGKHAYVACVDQNAIQVLDTVTYQITATVPVGKSPTSVAISTDGRQAYVTNLADGTVTTLNIAGTA